MKQLRMVLLPLLVLILVSGFVFAEGQKESDGKAAAKPVTLRLSTHHPADVSRSVGSRLLKEEIEKATNGMVKIDIYYSESLAKGREVLDAVKQRVVDIGDVNPAYYPGQLPLHSGILAFTKVPPRYSQKVEVMANAYAKYPQFRQEIENYNQKILWQYFPGSLNLSSTTLVESIDDFKGLKIRASSEVYLRMLKDLGAIPVSVPFTDVYMALQTGTIDGVFTNIEAMTGQKFWEPAPYSFTSEDLGLWLPFTFTINKDTWDKLSPEIQQQIETATARVSERYGPMFDQAYADEVATFTKYGKSLLMASARDVEIWQNVPILETIKKELAARAKEAGIANGQQFVDDFERFIDESMQK